MKDSNNYDMKYIFQIHY